MSFRIFDRNKDGFINKKEFKMMTTASKFSMKKIETVFAVSFLLEGAVWSLFK